MAKRPAKNPRLEALVAAALERGRQRYPTAKVEPEALTELLAGCPEQGELHLEDLYLVAGLVMKDRASLAIFEKEHLSKLGPALGQLNLTRAEQDDVRADVSLRLLVDPGRIGDYAGTGALLRWVRAAAVRIGLNLLRRRKHEAPAQSGSSLFAGATDADLKLVRLRFRGPFKQALKAAIAKLAPEQRLLLRQYYSDGTGVEALGRLYAVSTATASRRVTAARQHLGDLVRAELQGVAKGTELEELIGDLLNQLTFSGELFA